MTYKCEYTKARGESKICWTTISLVKQNVTVRHRKQLHKLSYKAQNGHRSRILRWYKYFITELDSSFSSHIARTTQLIFLTHK